MMKQVKWYCHRNTLFGLESILLSITGTSTLVLRRADIEAIAQGELDATGVVVLHLANHKAVAIEGEAINTVIKEVVTCQFNVETTLKEILADAE